MSCLWTILLADWTTIWADVSVLRVSRYQVDSSYMYSQANGYTAYNTDSGRSQTSPGSQTFSPTPSPTTPHPVTLLRTVDLLDVGG